MPLPQFRYHPEPDSVFQKARRKCPQCGVMRDLEYVGQQYGLAEIEHLCGYCIADGSAARKFELEFTNPDGTEPGPGSEKFDELVHRTPGYEGPEGDPWPVHCDDYCAHLGRVGWRDITPVFADVEADIREFCAIDMDLEEFEAEVKRDRSPLLVHLFRCLNCGRHRLTAGYE